MDFLRKDSLFSWFVCFSAALLLFYEIFQASMFNVISVDLLKAYQINATQLGFFSSTYFYANIVFLLPAGILLERFSTRKILLLVTAVCILATFAFSFSHALWVGVVSRALIGAGNGIAFLACMRLATRWFSPKRYAIVMGLIVTVAMLGGVIAQTPFTLLVQYSNWREALVIVGWAGIGILMLIWFFVYDYPKDVALVQTQIKKASQNLGLSRAILLALKQPSNVLCGVFAGLLNLPVMMLGALWGNLYLIQGRGLSQTDASNVTSMIFFGMIIGAPMIGWISDNIGLRKLPMWVSACLAILIVMLVIDLPHITLTGFLLLFFVLGLLSSVQVLSYPVLAETNRPELTSISMSIMAVVFNGCVALSQPLFGWLMRFSHHAHAFASNVHGYSTQDYQFALWLLPVAFLISFIAALLLKETRCRTQFNDSIKIQ